MVVYCGTELKVVCYGTTVGATLRTLVWSPSIPFLINASVRLYEVSELKPEILEP